jgi:hypothetical protein
MSYGMHYDEKSNKEKTIMKVQKCIECGQQTAYKTEKCIICGGIEFTYSQKFIKEEKESENK